MSETCIADGCTAPAKTMRLCGAHYQRWWKRNRKTQPTRSCEVPGCARPHRARGMCSTHYNQAAGDARHRPDATPRPTPTSDAVPTPSGTWVGGNCDNCGKPFLARRSRHWPRWCSKPCEARHNHTTRRARAAGATGTYSRREFDALVALLDGRCAYCRRLTARHEADHITPLALGGSNDIGNIAPACPRCNRQKGARTVQEWNAMRAAYGQTPRSLDPRLEAAR